MLQVYFCVWCKVVVEFNFFACSCPYLTTPFVEEAIFTLFYASAHFVKYYLTIKAWVNFWALYSVPLIYVSILCQYQTVDYSTFYYSFMSVIVIPPTLFFFLKIAEAIQGHLWFHINI